ncbi:MAG: hypothetical protein ACE10C_09015, partial [Candidatus Binatia bacterium]
VGGRLFLVSRPMNTMSFANGTWEGRSRSEEEVMKEHRRPRETKKRGGPKKSGGQAPVFGVRS